MNVPRKAVVIAIVVSVLLSMPYGGVGWNRYSLFMHIFGAIIFMGNIIVTAVWASLARRDGSLPAIRFASRGVMWADVMFTLPGAILLLLNGGIVGTPYFKAGASWLILSLVLFFVGAAIWLGFLIPVQRRLVRISHEAPDGGPAPEECFDLLKKWFKWGGIATLLPLITLVLMVLKPALW